ncbi:hypothetical protein RclHR1_04410002 [Rhizophagus clarus]|uniref:BTB/POZ domain-containing protein n=1 Tax=Rhizophagus clarus TaxID=94130 RepID=A0A2Z6SBM1_9GLOM|nr:hypothetical protein RclHR1_04410002 [Rhizophagus clarus]GES81029.1 BTB/POZ domain-containing protein [Rhizophagus clarus]
MSYNFRSEVPEALGQLLKTATDYNVIIHVGENPYNFKEFHAHSIILRCRSEYFNKIFSSKDIEKINGKYMIKKPNISPKAFDVILKYLYTGQFIITNKTGIELLDIMITSDELMLKKLTKLTESFIIENCHQFLRNDPVEILHTIYYNKQLISLQEFYLNKICIEPKFLFNSDRFTQLSAHLLEIILKRDDLNLEEIEIWENLIKWGLAQERALNQDVTKWKQNDINTFKWVLSKFIPLIRFYEISTRDYFNKVKPYEEILPKELRDDILKFYMIPEYKPIYIPRRSKFINGSIMINREHAILFANWIDKKEENDEYINDIPYEFNLLYRASRDGNTATAFHVKCDNEGPTIVVVKIRNSEQIVGGYNPLFWDSVPGKMSTKDSFIFSFMDKNYVQNAKVVYSGGYPYSIYCHPVNGPVFGCHDLYVNYNVNSDVWYSACKTCYPTLDLPESMNADDYEVFQVIKKESI